MTKWLFTMLVIGLAPTVTAEIRIADPGDGSPHRAGFLASARISDVRAARAGCRSGDGPPFDLSRIDRAVTEAFAVAWRQSDIGYGRHEAVVLIRAAPDGSYVAIDQGYTNEHFKLSFKRGCDVIAIVHTHPNRVIPVPSPHDQQVARYLGVPIATITSEGMFVYDPVENVTTKVLERLDWLRADAFRERAAVLSARRSSPRTDQNWSSPARQP